MKWISVKDSLPEANIEVLAIDDSNIMNVLSYCDYYNEWLDFHGNKYFSSKYITHWMPLPGYPKRNNK